MMAIWERVTYVHDGTDYTFLYRYDFSTATHEFRPEWPGVFQPIDFDPEQALREAMKRAVEQDTTEGYMKAAKYRDMLQGIKPKKQAA